MEIKSEYWGIVKKHVRRPNMLWSTVLNAFRSAKCACQTTYLMNDFGNYVRFQGP